MALSPTDGLAAGQAHVAGCERCRSLSAMVDLHMPHLSLWTLIRHLQGGLSDIERRAYEYHVGMGQCARCLARTASLERIRDRIIQFPAGVTLADPLAAHAAMPAELRVAQTSDGSLEAELVADTRRATLEIRTRDPKMTRYVLGYALRGEDPDQDLEGYTVLGPDTQGWFVAEVPFDPQEIHRRFRGRCEAITIAPVEPTMLGILDGERLVAAVARESRDPDRHSAWLRWVEQVAPRQSPRGKGDDLLCAVVAALRD